MPTTKRPPPDNLLLAALPVEVRRRLIGESAPVELNFAETLHESGDTIRDVYFPLNGFISLITPADGRAQLEVGLVGSEGMLGVSVILGVDTSPLRALVQGTGTAWRVDVAHLSRVLEDSGPARALLNRYLYVLLTQLTQSAICTRFHLVEARLARWLLMTRDRARANRFHVTHEFLAYMLGVRRVGVTSAASALQKRKLIHYARGDISILNSRGLAAAACKCYAADRKTYARIMA
ncbi:MAG: Crp/Fnr family transcriptional regulator [Pseudomonadota bacterium]